MKRKRGRPSTARIEPTAFSTWLAQTLAAQPFDKAGAAKHLGVDVKTLYKWLSGKDPRTPHVIQLGIAAAFGLSPTARSSQDSGTGAEAGSQGDVAMSHEYEVIGQAITRIWHAHATNPYAALVWAMLTKLVTTYDEAAPVQSAASPSRPRHPSVRARGAHAP